jgi:hypothetical protein
MGRGATCAARHFLVLVVRLTVPFTVFAPGDAFPRLTLPIGGALVGAFSGAFGTCLGMVRFTIELPAPLCHLRRRRR